MSAGKTLPVRMVTTGVTRQKFARPEGGCTGVGALATVIAGEPTLMVAMRHRDGTTLTVQLAGAELDNFGHVFGDAVNLLNALSNPAAAGTGTVQ